MNLNTVQIRTDRLLLVPITMEYSQVIFKEFQQPVTELMYPKPPVEIQETEIFIRESFEGLQKGTNLQMVILDKTTKEFLGCAGLHELAKRDPELGVWIKMSAHGHKYGREAMKGIKDWADQHLDYIHLRYPVAEQNIPSRKIAESLGGTIATEYDLKNLSGRMHHLVEYWIPKNL